MWCGGACVIWVLTAALMMKSGRTDQEPAGAPRCRDPRCRFLRHENGAFVNKVLHFHYEVEGNIIMITRQPSPQTIRIECKGASVLESPAMPRFEPACSVQRVVLWNCPLPTTGSLQDTLHKFNVTFCDENYLNEQCELTLYTLPSAEPSLTGKLFNGLEHVQVVTIDNILNTAVNANAELGFLTALSSLRKLMVRHVAIPVGGLDSSLPLLDSLKLRFTGIERLPEAIHSSINLQELTIQDQVPLDAVSVPPRVRELFLDSSATTLRLDSAPALRKLKLYNWMEPLPQPIMPCTELRHMVLKGPAMRALPDGWLVNCSRLEKLDVSEARNLITLPLILPKSEIPLTSFIFTGGSLENVHEGVMDNVSQIQTLLLNNNRIKNLPRKLFREGIFLDLEIVNLSSNDLDSSVFDVLEHLRSYHLYGIHGLLELDLSHNPRIDDFCDDSRDADGYSRFRNMSSLRQLNLRETGVSRICKDWREGMPDLQLLDLRNTSVSELSFKELQYKRNVKAQVMLQGAPVTAVQVSRENYNEALHASPSFTSMHISTELVCDCHMYWARRALEPHLHALSSIRELRCVGGGLLRDLPSEDMVCAARGECVTAGLPAGCGCTARPDDDTNYDHWLVRMRCENNSLGLVPRRIYPFYLLYKSNNEGFYLADNFTPIN